MAEQDIVERLREVNITRYDEAGEGHVGPCMVEHRNGDYVQHSDHLAVVDKLTTENASLRQQLAEAREALTRINDATPRSTNSVDAKEAFAFAGAVAATALANIRALSHPDREGERE